MDLAKSPLLRERSSEVERVRLARDRIHAGREPDPANVRPVILESWRRSRHAGVDPRLESGPLGAKPTERSEDALRAAAAPVLGLLEAAIDGESFLLLLADRHCQPLDVFGPAGMLRESERINAVSGSEWSEPRVGTDAVALCMTLGAPMQVHWYENYAAVGDRWTGNAAPVRDLTSGRLLGAVSLYGYDCIAHPQALELTVHAAAMVERRFADDERRDRLGAFEHYGRHLARYPGDAALCLDPQGTVLALSSAAAALLGVQAEKAIGRPLPALPGISYDEEIRDWTARSSVALRCGEHRLSGEIAPIGSDRAPSGYLLRLEGAKRARSAVRSAGAWRAIYRFSDVIGESAAIEKARASARIAAARDCTTLLIGETGTGKELFAHAIHAASGRAAGPFVALNCGALGDELLAAELFGYEDGAFTGAARGGRPGKLELADGGTLFLDEIEAMSPRMQAALLRVLEERRVLRLGGERPREIDVRLVAASNVDLRREEARRGFRQDLFHRLSTFPIEIPPLRARTSDLPELAALLLRQEGLAKELSPEALERLARHRWPGNVRELRNVLLQAALRAPPTVIREEDLPLEPNEPASTAPAVGDALHRAERRALLEALHRNDGSIRDAARDLGIHRVTLYRKLKRHGIRAQHGYPVS